jgi:hypothetical protein
MRMDQTPAIGGYRLGPVLFSAMIAMAKSELARVCVSRARVGGDWDEMGNLCQSVAGCGKTIGSCAGVVIAIVLRYYSAMRHGNGRAVPPGKFEKHSRV